MNITKCKIITTITFINPILAIFLSIANPFVCDAKCRITIKGILSLAIVFYVQEYILYTVPIITIE